MKQRFSLIDVAAIVCDLRSKVVGLRLQNVYDINSRTFLFKFARTDHKVLMLVESGMRVHTTAFAREKPTIPSSFCAKLRKHVRTRRCTGVRQLGKDRVVMFDFIGATPANSFHIICEFYASGNVILTDGDYTILNVLRTVAPTAQSPHATMVRETYPAAEILAQYQSDLATRDSRPNIRRFVDAWHEYVETHDGTGKVETLKKIVSQATDFGSQLAEHVIRQADLDPSLKATDGALDLSKASEAYKALEESFRRLDDWVSNMVLKGLPQPGYIVVKKACNPRKGKAVDANEESDIMFDDFCPILLAQHSADPELVKSFESFDVAVDTFFSRSESQLVDSRTRAQEEAAAKKLEAVKRDQFKRVSNLRESQQRDLRRAAVIEGNVSVIDKAISLVRERLDAGMDWKKIWINVQDIAKDVQSASTDESEVVEYDELAESEAARCVEAARRIVSLKLERRMMTMLLPDPDEDEEDSELEASDTESVASSKNAKQKPTQSDGLRVDIKLDLTGYANVRALYTQKKQMASKMEKTLAISEKAFKSAERKITQDMKQIRVQNTISKVRKPLWFEKFLWFISSENYLILGGRDMQQNELLVKRHLRKDDKYVHADMHGAATVIIKNHDGGEVPPSTLYQAGIMSVCQSKAWDAKIPAGAFWVNADQVSKTAPTGEYLSTGSFMIRGRRNFLPPVQLVYGFAYMFRLDESCIAAHYHERRPHLRDADDDGRVGESATKAEDSSLSRNWDKYKLEDLGEEVHFVEGEVGQSKDSSKTPAGSSKSIVDQLIDSTKVVDEVDVKRRQDAQDRKKQQNKAGMSAKSAKESAILNKAAPKLSGRRGKGKKKDNAFDSDDERWTMKAKSVPSVEESDEDAEAAELPMSKLNEDSGEATLALESVVTSQMHEDVVEEDDEVTVDPIGDIADDADDTEEIRKLLAEENVVMLDTEDADSLTLLDTLTGQPLTEDMLLHAIPVCGPYSALQKYKFKVKLTPGSAKKGKACKSITDYFLRQPETSARERDLLKAVPEAEQIAVILGKVKVSMTTDSAAGKSGKGKGK